MSLRLENKVALVTGAGRGVGRADAIRLATEGAQVILTDINAREGEAVAQEIGERARFIPQDVSSENQWKQIVALIEKDYGRLDILVNNAAILQLADVTEETLAGWRRVFSINTESVFLGVQHCLPLLEQTGGGSIINMSSSSALFGLPQFAAYSASKAAVRGFTQSVAVYCNQRGKGVRCNSLHPDSIATPMTMEIAAQAGGRQLADSDRVKPFVCSPEDVANTVLFLASDESRHINGATISLDGGATITPPYL
ncbi:MAG: SDR family oxidoreductase [Gammaproteobacteria bacterium]|uniref:SDR family oxidoreductase n=1 Tax=Pseudomaricurvus alcaniphilus TaxID=1166482 RepID=UPI00140D1D9B|nr:SDR family oxidoreductase [Pseudomaricurvus alcaniphilus]MBR9912981.1 SDR family oxidoreductase [Gammaproteobacteria bacterium]NHN36463.1 SDR family oxidoreductase [Pseudomaricurvus alcaniphilus]